MPKSNNLIKADSIAHRFFNEEDIIRFNGSFYLYNEGIWREESYENTLAWIGHIYRKVHAEACSTNQLKQIIAFIERDTYQRYRKKIKYISEENHTPRDINTKSGILDLQTMKIRPYTKDEFRFHKLSFDYKEEINCQRLAKFLCTSMNYKSVNDYDLDDEYKPIMIFIQEWMGYTLVSGNPHQKSLILTGTGRNGKGTLIWLWKRLLNSVNVSNLDISLFSNNVMLSELENKLVNFSSDIEEGQRLDTGVMKRLTSEEEIVSRKLYHNPKTFKFLGKIIMACNSLPRIGTVNPSVADRFHILPFEKRFSDSERDIHLKDKLEKEIEDIFSWAVNGYIRLKKRGFFMVPKRCKMSMERYLQDYDKLAQWLEDENIATESPQDMVVRSELWRHYKHFCLSNGYKTGTIAEFYRKMEQKGFNQKKTGGKRYFTCIKKPLNSSIIN